MMRRLLLILLAWMAFAPPALANATHRHAHPCAACPGSPGHDADCADHGCLGCSIAPETMPDVAPRPEAVALRLRETVGPALIPYRPAFDPPPPRAVG